ncbi:MAG: hypothetical protein AAGD01_13590 [Acidobacteriota bacterium]
MISTLSRSSSASLRSAVVRTVALAILALVLTVSSACEQKTPLQRAVDLRAEYTAELNTSGFAVTPHQPEILVEDEAETDDAGEGEDSGEAADEGTDGIDGAENGALGDSDDAGEVIPEPTGFDVLLDLVLANGNRETLDQLTVEIVQLNPDQSEKQRWRHTFDVADLLQGMTVQQAYKLENIDYKEGDLFYAEVRTNVPAEERGEYPELAGLEG